MDKKISQLGATTVPVNADLFAIVQSGVTKKITYQNLVAAIVAETSLDLNQVLTNGNTTGGKNIVVTNGDTFISTDGKGGLAIGTGGYAELSSSGFDSTKSFFYVDETDASMISQGINGITTNASYITAYHGSEIRINAPDVRILGNVLTSSVANKARIYFGASGNQLLFTTDGGTFAEAWTNFSTVNARIGYNDKSLYINNSEIYFDAPAYTFGSLTATTVPYIDASKRLVSSAITPTELGYLTGATSSIQSQIDALVSGLSWKQAVRVATTGAGTLASDFENGDTIDGVILVTGDRILIKDQAAATENGIYIVNASGAPTRSSDMNVAAEFPSATVAVSAGTVNADTQWVCTNNSVIIGITSITFVAVGGTSYIGTTNRITVTGNQIDISATFEALLGKVANPLSQFASTTSAQLAGVISDETGTGSLVFSASPAFTGNPTATTQTNGNDSTRIATTEFVVDARPVARFYSDSLANSPGDNGVFYYGTLNNYVVEPSNSYRIVAPKTNAIFHVSFSAIVRGTLGSNETSTVKIQNITQATEETLSTSITHEKRLNYTHAVSTLAITAGDAITIQVTNPAWATNPTTVQYQWILEVY